MKRIFAFVLVLILAISLCACTIGPETFETPDGATIEVAAVENDTIVFEHNAKWTVTKLEKNVYYKGSSSAGRAYTTFSAVLASEEYVCYVYISEEYYSLLNEDDVVDATYSELFLGTHLTKKSFTFTNGETFSATCYKNTKIGE